MRRTVWISVLVALVAASREPAAQLPPCLPWRESWLGTLGPIGGWHPYGGGLLNWWNPSCFPRCGAPDDYRRKPLPCVCWPPYPPYYTWGKAEFGCPQSHSARDGKIP